MIAKVTRQISNVGRMCSIDKLKVRIVEEKLNILQKEKDLLGM